MENHYHAYALEVLGDGRKAWVMLPGDYRLAKTAWNNGKKGAAKVAKDTGRTSYTTVMRCHPEGLAICTVDG